MPAGSGNPVPVRRSETSHNRLAMSSSSASLTAAHEALVAGIAANILDAVVRNPDDIEAHHAAALLCSVAAAVLAPLCPSAPTDTRPPDTTPGPGRRVLIDTAKPTANLARVSPLRR